jgi:hypothetical protein
MTSRAKVAFYAFAIVIFVPAAATAASTASSFTNGCPASQPVMVQTSSSSTSLKHYHRHAAASGGLYRISPMPAFALTSYPNLPRTDGVTEWQLQDEGTITGELTGYGTFCS